MDNGCGGCVLFLVVVGILLALYAIWFPLGLIATLLVIFA